MEHPLSPAVAGDQGKDSIGLSIFPEPIASTLRVARLAKPPRPESDPMAVLERTWERYRDRVEALVRESGSDQNRGKIVGALAKHAKLIEKLGRSAALKGALAT
jgi:hypothetical protein